MHDEKNEYEQRSKRFNTKNRFVISRFIFKQKLLLQNDLKFSKHEIFFKQTVRQIVVRGNPFGGRSAPFVD